MDVSPADPTVATRIDIELRMLDDAIELVRRHASRRVTLGGLLFGDQLLERARAVVSDGVRVRALYSTDESGGTDLVVERVDHPALPATSR